MAIKFGVGAMKAADVMVANVIVIGPDPCVQDVARILLSSHISGVPVLGSDGNSDLLPVRASRIV